MKKKKIPYGQKISVTLKAIEHKYILRETFVEPEAFGLGVVGENNITFWLSLDDIDYIQGFIAAAANHSEHKKTQKSWTDISNIFRNILKNTMTKIDRKGVCAYSGDSGQPEPGMQVMPAVRFQKEIN